MGLVSVLATVLMLAACERIEKAKHIGQALEQAFEDVGTTKLVWDEEVKLHDGRVIVIRRREVKSGGGFPVNSMNPRGITRSYEFCYPSMGLYWKSKGEYEPEILAVVDGKAYVKVPISGGQCKLHDYPTTNAIYFVWENSAWKQIPYEQFPKEIRRTNLLLEAFGSKPENDAHGLVTMFQKEKRDSIYIAMRDTNGRIQSLTDYPDMRGECDNRKKNRGAGGIQTIDAPVVFLPPTPDLCK